MKERTSHGRAAETGVGTLLDAVNDDAAPSGLRVAAATATAAGEAAARADPDPQAAAACGAPLIGIACDSGHSEVPFDGQLRRHAEAVERTLGGIPVLIPNGLAPATLASLIMRLDGLILTGSETDLLPAPYRPATDGAPDGRDAARMAAAVQMIQAALSSAVPMLGICGGLHEINVAFDGTLHAALHDIPGMLDHRGDRAAPVESRYAPVHDVRVVGDRLGAVLDAAGLGRRLRVNSRHGRGIDRVAPGLAVEATAPDGLVEAVSIADAPCFAMAVQWHPEWTHGEDPVSAALYAALAEAARRRRIAETPGRDPLGLETTPAAG